MTRPEIGNKPRCWLDALVVRAWVKAPSRRTDPIGNALSDKVTEGPARRFLTQPTRSLLPINIVDIDLAHDGVYHGSSCLALWHNLGKNDMINLVFRRPNNAPSERPTPVAPVRATILILPPGVKLSEWFGAFGFPHQFPVSVVDKNSDASAGLRPN